MKMICPEFGKSCNSLTCNHRGIHEKRADCYDSNETTCLACKEVKDKEKWDKIAESEE